MIKHTVNGHQALTIEDLAERYKMGVSSITSLLTREKQAGRPVPVLDVCGRKALYDPKAFAKVIKARPGRGARGVARKPRAGRVEQDQQR
jgi:hypothetical protein